MGFRAANGGGGAGEAVRGLEKKRDEKRVGIGGMSAAMLFRKRVMICGRVCYNLMNELTQYFPRGGSESRSPWAVWSRFRGLGPLVWLKTATRRLPASAA